MKAIIFLLALFLVANAAHAQQARVPDCDGWITVLSTGDGVTAKMFYLVGFRDGIAAMAIVNAANKQREAEVMANVWREGVIPDQMRMRLDEYCRRPENRDIPIAAAIVEITRALRIVPY